MAPQMSPGPVPAAAALGAARAGLDDVFGAVGSVAVAV